MPLRIYLDNHCLEVKKLMMKVAGEKAIGKVKVLVIEVNNHNSLTRDL